MSDQARPARQENRYDPSVRGRRRSRPGHRDPGGSEPRGRHPHDGARRLLRRRARLRREAAAPREQAGARPGQSGRDQPRRSRRRFIRELRLPAEEVAKFSVGQILGAHGHLRRRRRDRRQRHEQGQGLSGRVQAPPHEGHEDDARYSRVLPSRWLDRVPPDPAARPQGQAHGGSHRRREEDGAEPPAVQGPRRRQLHPRPRRDSGLGERLRGRDQGRDSRPYKRKGLGKEEVRSKNPLKASKKAAAGRG